MLEPRSSRPYMPGYGTLPADEGTGLLPWSWALERLHDSHDYWLSTVWPDGRPHLMPVWAVWHEDTLWFSSSLRSRKIRNVSLSPIVSLGTDDALNPVVIEGVAEVVTEHQALQAFLAAVNAKYQTTYTMDLVDPAKSASVVVRPRWAFGLDEKDFGGSPTRWDFG